MKRKILSLILVFAMTVSLFTVGTGAVEPTYGDTAGHWAESSIERWSAYGIIQGSNGQFDPNGQLTCAQLATILAKLLKLPAAKDAGFTDNTADAWYYDAINRCAAAGILNGNGDGTVTPEAPITRERAMVMLARALGIEPLRKPDLTKYTDAAQVSAYAQGYVAALIEAGIVGGVTADELAPQANITRAATVTILDRAIGVYADKDGMTVNAKDGELVLVVAKNVKVINAPEGTKIVVADGATGLTVNGKSVSDDQTYIVPKATTSSGSSSGGYSHSHTWVDNYCNGCGQFKDTVVAAIGKKGYETVAAVITAANGSGTVTLLKATTETIQEILDGQHGSIDGLTIELPTGNYGQLELGRATKYEGSNTKYYLGGIESNVNAIKQNIVDHPNGGAGKREYVRSMSNVTLKAADGATVNVAGVKMTSGHMYGSSGAPNYDYVLDREVLSTNDSYYLAQTVSNITFDGLNFTAKSDINTSIPESTINGFTFKNCTFNINNTADGNQAIRYYNENNNGKVSNLVVDNCKFNNCFQGVYTHHVKNVIVTNSEFDTTGHNAIAIQDHSGACNHGKVIITGNTFKNIGDRIIRFNNVGAGTQITITHNTVIGKLIKKEVIKAESLAAGVTCNIHSNSWGDGATFGDGFTEETGEPCAEINGVKYISLAKALAAAQDGDTVKLVQDITPTERIVVTGDKNITIDLAEKKITSKADVAIVNDGTGKLTITGNGTVDTSLSTNDENIAIWARTGSIDIENGTFINKSNKEATVYVGTSESANEPVITIKGGTFKNSAEGTYTYNSSLKPLTLNVQNGKPVTSIVITGGTFVGQNPGDGDDNLGGTFLAEGYKATKDESANTWTVKKMDGYVKIEGLSGWYETLTDAAKAWRESNQVVTRGNTFGMNSLGSVESITWTVSGVVAIGNGEGVIGDNGAGQSILGGGYFTPSVTVNDITIKGSNGAKIIKTGDSYLVSAAGKNVVYEDITFVDTVRIDSNPAKLTFKNCTFEAGFRMPHSATNGEVTIENCTFTGNESSGYAIFAQGIMASFKVTDSTISNCQRGINVQAGDTAEVTISGNTIENLTGKTENEFTYGSAIQLTSAKTFSVTNNTIGTSEASIPVNAFHIYKGCAADSIKITDNTVYAKYLCLNEATDAGVTYDMSKVTFNNTCTIEVPNKCCTKTGVIDSAFTLPQ